MDRYEFKAFGSDYHSKALGDLSSENYWFESIEEYLGAMIGAKRKSEDVDGAVSPLLGELSDESRQLLESKTPVLPLGLCFPEEEGATLSDTIPPFLGSSKSIENIELPDSIRLMNAFFTVRNQGHRGTCVGFASTAFREYLGSCQTELSEQFLYWACKQIDGIPHLSGTYVSTAMSVLQNTGICAEVLWPYNPEPIPGNEGQGPPMDGAEEGAREFRYHAIRKVPDHDVKAYKAVLAGVDGQPSMPIVFGVDVFDSWYGSPVTRITGKITMPLPGEVRSGGHAMLVVGYQDDHTVPGGGYFIVRNSWGEDWAIQSKEANGHALIPYAYVERYAHGAYSAYFENSGKNEDFTEVTTDQDEEIGQQELVEEVEVNSADIARRAEFMEAVHKNVINLQGTHMADSGLPKWISLVPWMPRIKSIEVINDVGLKKALVNKWLSNGNRRKAADLNYEYDEKLDQLFDYRIYELKGLGATFHIVSAFVYSKGETGVKEIQLLQEIFKQWSKKKKSRYVYYTIGTNRGWHEELESYVHNSSHILLSEKTFDGWDTIPHENDLNIRHYYTRQFLYNLYPLTDDYRMIRVKQEVDDYCTMGNYITVEKAMEKTGYSKENVEKLFDGLQKTDEYVGEKVTMNETVTRVIKRGVGKGIRFRKRRLILKRALYMSAAFTISVVISGFSGLVKTDNYWLGIVLSTSAVYLANIVRSNMERKDN